MIEEFAEGKHGVRAAAAAVRKAVSANKRFLRDTLKLVAGRLKAHIF
jgi:hypothetical protein